MYCKYCFDDKVKVIEKMQCGISRAKILRNLFPFDEDIFICHTYIQPHGSKVINYEETSDGPFRILNSEF